MFIVPVLDPQSEIRDKKGTSHGRGEEGAEKGEICSDGDGGENKIEIDERVPAAVIIPAV